MSLLGSSPALEARKSKTVRKLLLEGVPASVRCLIWNHLTSGKGKALPSVYPQLCKRGPVPLGDRLEADIETNIWFLDEKQSQLQTLREAGGGIVQLLEAYLNMVPDMQYSPGLPHIVGQLLPVAPKEDAFWMFVSITDSHIRPYLASGSAQMDVDASLFKAALEADDILRCRFASRGFLPSSLDAFPMTISHKPGTYSHPRCPIPPPSWPRYHLFLPPSTARIHLGRGCLEHASSPSTHPPPPNTDNYLASALNIKVKDDDVRKQRAKLEAHVKHQTQ
ncbi:RabGAP TBC [Coprinopsis sp. MPI-PUGE-AT-0042]|nr:RabGAP TBC [Coprinopsis sp. MPI-PUGE-AT-0042]